MSHSTSVLIGDALRVIAILLVGASVVRAAQVMRLYYGVQRELSAEERKLRILPAHAWKQSLAYLGLCLGLALAHALGFGKPMTVLPFIDIPIFLLGLSAISDVYKFQRVRIGALEQKHKGDAERGRRSGDQ